MVRIRRAAKILGVHPQTLRRLERRGVAKPHRSISGQRWYATHDLILFAMAMGRDPVVIVHRMARAARTRVGVS